LSRERFLLEITLRNTESVKDSPENTESAIVRAEAIY
jgi:hypothetical protein